MNAPASLVSWLIAELEARRAEIEGDFNGINAGEVSQSFNRNRGTIAVETRVRRTYAPSRKTESQT